MEGDWWYLKDGKRQGPLPIADLRDRLSAGEIGPGTKVWRKGMDGWARMAEVTALRELLEDCPPAVDGEGEGGQLDADTLTEPCAASFPESVSIAVQARPLSRLLARYIDILVFGAMAWLALDALYPEFANLPFMDNRLSDSILGVGLGLLVEVPVMAITGTTIGKWIFGITVRRVDGGRLGMRDVIRRNLLLWVYGLGLGIPLMNQIMLFKSYQTAKQGRRNIWDEDHLHNVRQKPIGGLREMAGFAILMALLMGLMALHEMDGLPRRATAHANAPTPAETWVNPFTGNSAGLHAGWRSVPERTKENPDAFWFENADSVIIIGRDVVASADPVAYIDSLRANNDFGALEDRKVEIDASGMRYHVLMHRIETDAGHYRVDVRVWQAPPTDSRSSVYWRSVAITPLHDERKRAAVRSLAESLERTSLAEGSQELPTDGKRF